jgi:hypothetical protein
MKEAVMLSIINASGQHRFVRIAKFAALDGWDIQQRFIDFAISRDKEVRKKFAIEILKYATVVNGEQEIPLITNALVDNHLQSWQNVQIVFEAVLMENGIDPHTHANKPYYWSEAGTLMATAFIEHTAEFIAPALSVIAEIRGNKNDQPA